VCRYCHTALRCGSAIYKQSWALVRHGMLVSSAAFGPMRAM